MNVSLSTLPVGEYLADWHMGYGKFTVKLPPGEYKLSTYGNAQGFTKTISLRADEPILNPGRIELDVPIIERQTGKVPPP